MTWRVEMMEEISWGEDLGGGGKSENPVARAKQHCRKGWLGMVDVSESELWGKVAGLREKIGHKIILERGGGDQRKIGAVSGEIRGTGIEIAG